MLQINVSGYADEFTLSAQGQSLYVRIRFCKRQILAYNDDPHTKIIKIFPMVVVP